MQSLRTGSYYTGFTHDLRKRLAEHNKGKNVSTRPGAPWEVIFYEAYRVQKEYYPG